METRDTPATGRCLCGAVSFAVRGALRDVLVCHCADCRRWHGHACGMTSARREHVEIADSGHLMWFANPDGPRRGFCRRCGSSLFWDAPERETLTIAAGTLNPPTNLRTRGHIYWGDASDYEVTADDGLPRHPGAAPPSEVAPPVS